MQTVLLPLFRLILLGIPLVLLFVYAFDQGIRGIWYGLAVANVVSGVFGFFLVQRSLRMLAPEEPVVAPALAE